MTTKLSYRIAEESQLLAEEKWLIESIAKIKNQRNCLQIERLHLESLKAKIKYGSDRTPDVSQPTPTTSAVNIMQKAPTASSRLNLEFEVPVVETMGEDTCNEEELDLSITKSVFSQFTHNDNMEEYEEDEDLTDNVAEDMTMNEWMNGGMNF